MSVVVPANAPHLGGYIAGGDAATVYPDLWKWLVTDHGVRSVIDVGCGDGVAVRAFDELGCGVIGIDGVSQPDDCILEHDYTAGPVDWSALKSSGVTWSSTRRAWAPGWSPELEEPRVSLVWCCEFVEHVDERYLPNVLSTFRCADLILMTHAWPGQQGHHHVNCRQADYWIGVMAAIGYRWDWDMTTLTRAVAAINPSEWNHYARSGLAFRRN